MPVVYSEFDSTNANVVADVRARILASTDWAVLTGNILKATAPSGAQLVVNLTDAAATNERMQLGVFRAHDGTTAVDKLTRFVRWRLGGTSTTGDVVHCVVSAGPEHVYIQIEGPRAGETNGGVNTRQCLALCTVTPYFTGGAAAVALLAPFTDSPHSKESILHVSRNHADTQSWVPARLLTLNPANGGAFGVDFLWHAFNRRGVDGNDYLWPYVILEDNGGLRGRLSSFFHAGYNDVTSAGRAELPGTRALIGTQPYVFVAPYRGDPTAGDSNNGPSWGPFGTARNHQNRVQSPIVAVPAS